MELTDIPVISASRLKMYEKCPRQYYLKYIKNEPMTTWSAAHMGHALHAAIAAKTIDPSAKQLLIFSEDFERCYEEIPVDSRNKGAHSKLGIEILLNHSYPYKPHIDAQGPFVEREFYLPYPNAHVPIVWIQGFIDLVTDAYELIDYKSSKEPSADLAKDLQFQIYHWAFEQLFGRAPTAVHWYHLRTQKTYAYIHENYDRLDMTIQKFLRDFGKGIKAFPKKKRDGFCDRVCSYKSFCW